MNTGHRVGLAAALLSGLVTLSACSSSAGAPADAGSEASIVQRACVPGLRQYCPCPGVTTMGVQDCTSDGTGFGACQDCPSTSPGGDAGGSDGSAGVDAGNTDAGPRPTTLGGPGYDGTSGLPCTTDADCKSVRGPQTNGCSKNFLYLMGGASVQGLPTPVCIVAPAASGGNCDPAPPTDPTGQGLHFCDGPDAPTSPGLCVPGTNPPSPGLGSCLPKCGFALDGSPAAGCVGKNTCVPFGYSIDGTAGYGFCQGTCQTDADCAALGTTFVCQIDTGACTSHRVVRTKQLGQACTVSDSASGACNCLPGTASPTGYCTSACVVGGAACPNGWVCENFEPSFATVANVGTAGLCVAPCSAPDAGQCPASSTCQNSTPVGPDCVP